MTEIERRLGAPEGAEISLPLDLIVTDDWTTPALLAPLRKLRIRDAAVPVAFVHDHTREPSAYRGADARKVRRLRRVRDAFVRRFGATLIEGRGIQHHVLHGAGLLRPGVRVLANDSHAPTLGAYGALAFAGQPTTVAAALRTGRLPLRVPPTLRVRLTGALPSDRTARDASLALLNRVRDGGPVPRLATGAALEFTGPGLRNLSPEQRAVLANAAPEALAVTAVFVDDATTDTPHRTVPEVELNLAAVRAGLARSGHAADVVPADTLAGTPDDRVFVGTCAGGTEAEIRAFAAAFAPGPDGRIPRAAVPTVVAPASRKVEERLGRDGLLDRLDAAGVRRLPPGCGPCFGFGVGRLRPNEVAVATANRNGVGRMGDPSAQVHLVGGRPAGLAARDGRIPGPEGPPPDACVRAAATCDAPGTDAPRPDAPVPPVSPGRARPPRPRAVPPAAGNVLRLHGPVTTDDLAPSSVPGVGTSNDADPAVLRRLLLHHLAPDLAERDLRGTVVVADHGFGAGSNRASSVRALAVAGVTAVIARGVAPLYAAGARDEGLPVLELHDPRFYAMATPDARVVADARTGAVTLTDATGATHRFAAVPLGPRASAIAEAGGTVQYLLAGGAW